MFDRPPLLEEPFAQTLSGKTGTGWTLQEAKVFVRNYRILKFLEMFLSLKN